MGSEYDLRELFIGVLKTKLARNDVEGLPANLEDDVAAETHLLSDFTFVPDDRGLRLYFGSQTADVVLSCSVDDLEDVVSTHELLTTSHGFSADDIKVHLVVVELKRGKHDATEPTTDAIRARSRAARDVKRIFPFAGYFLFVDQSTISKQKLYRAGKDFDGAFVTDDTADPQHIRVSVIDRGIMPHLERLAHLGIV